MWPLGRPGSRTRVQERPSLLVAWPITGSTVRTPVSGRRAGTVSSRRERTLGRARAMWSRSSTSSGWAAGGRPAAARAGAVRTPPATAVESVTASAVTTACFIR